MALAVSGSPERRDRRIIAIGMDVVASSTVEFNYAVPEGPVWLIALLAAIRGGGFGTAWTFILRRVTASCDPGEIHRVSGAIPTVQRLGYALGAACIGIVANASGILSMETPAEAAVVTRRVFLACLPFAGLACSRWRVWCVAVGMAARPETMAAKDGSAASVSALEPFAIEQDLPILHQTEECARIVACREMRADRPDEPVRSEEEHDPAQVVVWSRRRLPGRRPERPPRLRAQRQDLHPVGDILIRDEAIVDRARGLADGGMRQFMDDDALEEGARVQKAERSLRIAPIFQGRGRKQFDAPVSAMIKPDASLLKILDDPDIELLGHRWKIAVPKERLGLPGRTADEGRVLHVAVLDMYAAVRTHEAVRTGDRRAGDGGDQSNRLGGVLHSLEIIRLFYSEH